MIEAAITRGFVSLGFSGHGPMSYENCWDMKDEEGYCAEILALAEEYKGRIEIILGIEWDHVGYTDVSRYAYRIGSVHSVANERGRWEVDSYDQLTTCANEGFDGDYYALCREYYRCVTECALREGVDVVGHFDVVAKYNTDGRFWDEDDPRYVEPALAAIDAICTARPDIIFECNVGGMVRAGRKEPYPNLRFLKELRSRNMRITLTSDAHCAENLTEGFDKGIEFLRLAGYESVYILKDGKFTEVKI